MNSPAPKMICKHLIITGSVQGVGFRNAAFREARRLALAGWVRNLPSGEVELVVQGDPSSIKEFVQWCHKGPPTARVDLVNERDVQTEPGLRSFGIRKL